MRAAIFESSIANPPAAPDLPKQFRRAGHRLAEPVEAWRAGLESRKIINQLNSVGLIKYQQKRKFTQTSEPKGKEIKKSLNRFVVHKHKARNLHWDFRLELDGVLKSWAVPKEPPAVFGIKRLAMQVEDHPVDYLDFKGVIPKGNYGAGRVEIWDKGSFKLLDRRSSEIKFFLSGRRLKGKYVLIKPKGSRFGAKAWLFFKLRD